MRFVIVWIVSIVLLPVVISQEYLSSTLTYQLLLDLISDNLDLTSWPQTITYESLTYMVILVCIGLVVAVYVEILEEVYMWFRQWFNKRKERKAREKEEEERRRRQHELDAIAQKAKAKERVEQRQKARQNMGPQIELLSFEFLVRSENANYKPASVVNIETDSSIRPVIKLRLKDENLSGMRLPVHFEFISPSGESIPLTGLPRLTIGKENVISFERSKINVADLCVGKWKVIFSVGRKVKIPLAEQGFVVVGNDLERLREAIGADMQMLPGALEIASGTRSISQLFE